MAEGGQSAGFVIYVKNGKPVYHYTLFEIERTSVESNAPLPQGSSTVSFEFRYAVVLWQFVLNLFLALFPES